MNNRHKAARERRMYGKHMPAFSLVRTETDEELIGAIRFLLDCMDGTKPAQAQLNFENQFPNVGISADSTDHAGSIEYLASRLKLDWVNPAILNDPQQRDRDNYWDSQN